ncbi:MAG: hypothetical protein E7281_05845 [Lachnospiraceae bacterium]|nr:hypothetical protein [Lachnospiraceae bacterium]
MKKMSKPIVIAIIVAIIAIAGIGTGVAVKNNKLAGIKDEAYRIISVYNMEGQTEVIRENESMEPYVDMHLLSKDILKTYADSFMQIKMDEDKYLHVEPESVLSFEATGDAADSKTTIHLESGAVVNSIHNKLSNDSEYNVDTPNSTMAVRGTTFRVYYYKDKDGVIHTIIQTFSGTVEAKLVLPDGTVTDEVIKVEAGKEASIKMDGDKVELEYSDHDIDYSALNLETLEFLDICMKAGEDIVISETELEELIELKSQVFTVRFMNGTSVFGSQEVKYGKKASKPKLMPAESGKWNFDFDTEIYEDTDIKWTN